MQFIDSKNIFNIVRRTLKNVDERLVDHGQRVAYIVMKLLEGQSEYDIKAMSQIALTAALHDIGAYKTEEIDNMVQFETNHVGDHSIYGYLFGKYLSPFTQYAPIILFHHTDYQVLEEQDLPFKELAQAVNLADRIDILVNFREEKFTMEYLNKFRGTKFSPKLLDRFARINEGDYVLNQLQSEGYIKEVEAVLNKTPFSDREIDKTLQMLIFSIDFRSHYTVTHTIITTSISVELARLFGLADRQAEEIKCGALLHDLGKIGIPVEILEFPGKLTPQAMKCMRTHVDITEEIMGGEIDETIMRIALRHHEKLDGSGYPRGLTGDKLALSERIVAVADIISALSGKRSYKEAYEKDKIVGIITAMKEDGKLAPEVVDMMLEHFDEIMESVEKDCLPVLQIYDQIKAEQTKLENIYQKINGMEANDEGTGIEIRL